MRPKKPTHVLIDQVRITRVGNDATIDHADANLSGARITGIASMSDADIVEMYNQILDAQWALLQQWDNSRSRWARNRSTATKIAISGCRAATCSAASSTTAALTEKSLFISTTRNCHSPNSAGCSRFMRVGACGSRSCLRNSYPRIQRSKSASPSGESADTATGASCRSPRRDCKFEADTLAQTAPRIFLNDAPRVQASENLLQPRSFRITTRSTPTKMKSADVKIT